MKFSIAVLNCTKCLTKTQKYFYKLSGATSKGNILVPKLQSNYMFSSPYCFKTTKTTKVGIKSSEGRIQVFEVTDSITFLAIFSL